MSYDRQTIADLYDGRLPPWRVSEIMSAQKDPDRFRILRDILQERWQHSDRVLLPLTPRLCIVERPDSARVTKCSCGHDFGDYRLNWKLQALVKVRETPEAMAELYPQMMAANPQWMVLRELFCPSCRALLEVEAVPPGYPLVHDFEPDLEGFYIEWLGEPLQPAAPPTG